MVRRVLIPFAVLLVVFACRSNLNFPPRLATGAVSDTARLISVLPGSGAVHISKNGHRTFSLDAIVADEDDADSTITWSLSPGPGLEVMLSGDTARIGPVPNQVCTSYVVFNATDPGGLSTSRTCPIAVFEFRIPLDSMVMDSSSLVDTVLGCDYRPDLKTGLVWDNPVSDPAWLPECSLVDSSGVKVLRLRAGDSVGTTGIYLRISDPVNNVDFHHSIQVTIK
jgi:hypothetical protein